MEAETPRLLIVDDEEAIQIALKRILSSEGYEVVCAGNGTDGIDCALNQNFDIALLDLRMPDISGLEVLRFLKKERPNTVCYIVTAYASYESAIEATKMGADGYILKPFVPDELLQYLSVGLIRRRMLQEAERLKKEQAERLLELAFERSRLNTVINSLKDGVMVINTAVETVYFNPAVSLILNLPDLKIGDNTFESLPEELKDLIRTHFNSEQVPSVTYSITVRMPAEDKYMECSVSPVFLNGNTLGGIVIVFKDVTEYKKVEQIKSQFVSMVAHELKAPVAAVLGFLDIMRKPELAVSEEQKLDFINRSYKRLTSLLSMVNDLLDISRIEMNSVRREISRLNCKEIIDEVFDLLSVEVKNKKIIVKNEYNNPELLIIDGDRDELIRLFTNLISNAVKYNQEFGSISVSYQVSSNRIKISIADTGIGMKPEDVKRLFSEFFRVKNEITKSIHGTGLGLAIVKRILNAYSGTIEVQSEYRKGTTFTVALPMHFHQETHPV